MISLEQVIETAGRLPPEDRRRLQQWLTEQERRDAQAQMPAAQPPSAETPQQQIESFYADDFYTLYQSGQLDTGENLRDVTLWAGAYEMKLKLEEAARRLSQQRLAQLRADSPGAEIRLAPDQQAAA